MLRALLFSLLLFANIVSVEMDFEFGVYLTKPLLIPVLAWSLIGADWARVRWVLVALLLSWVGDILLMLPFDLFVFGLASFLLAHIFYIRHFWSAWDRSASPFQPLYLIGVMVYLIGLLYLLFPVLGAMQVPVIVYGTVISAMLLLALQTDRPGYRLGALLFVLSDSILAINKFHTPLPLASLWVMGTYGMAQFYLVKESRKEV